MPKTAPPLTLQAAQALLAKSALSGSVPGIKRALAAGADLEDVLEEDQELTALHLAISKNRREAAVFLLEQGASIHAEDTWGRDALMMAAAASAEMTREILKRGGDAERVTESLIENCMHQVCPAGAARNEDDAIERTRLLIQAGAPVDEENTDRNTPLRMACEAGKSRLALFLVDMGADVLSDNSYNNSAVDVAAKNISRAFAKRLAALAPMRDAARERLEMTRGAELLAELGASGPTLRL